LAEFFLENRLFWLQKRGKSKALKSCLPLPKQPPLSGPKAGFQAWGDGRRKKSAYVRHAKSQKRAAQAKALYAEGKTQQQIAAILGISQALVNKLLV
jgi:hypothetical protein